MSGEDEEIVPEAQPIKGRLLGALAAEDPLVLLIDTRLPGASLVYQITHSGTGSVITIDWGDGTPITGPGSHTYAEHGEYEIRVSGGAGRTITCGGPALREVASFGEGGAIGYLFGSGSSSRQSWNLTAVPAQIPALVTNMNIMFYEARAFNQDISGWNVGNVSIMNQMFERTRSFNQNLSGWCVSKIPAAPSNFDALATAWTLPRPVWGTCPARVTNLAARLTAPVRLTAKALRVAHIKAALSASPTLTARALRVAHAAARFIVNPILHARAQRRQPVIIDPVVSVETDSIFASVEMDRISATIEYNGITVEVS